MDVFIIMWGASKNDKKDVSVKFGLISTSINRCFQSDTISKKAKLSIE